MKAYATVNILNKFKILNLLHFYVLIINLVLNPLSLSTKAVLNVKPQQDNYKFPMFDFTILLESLGLNLNRLQVFIYFYFNQKYFLN